jgi:thiamine-monophosphate kinase
VPIDPTVESVTESASEQRELGVHFGEDFELVCTIPEAALSRAKTATPTELTRIGTVTDSGVRMDGEALSDRGFTHR